MSTEEDLHKNSFVEKVFAYFEFKGKEACLVVRDKASKEMQSKSSMKKVIAGKFLLQECGEQEVIDNGWFKGNKDNFPLIPGSIRDVMADAARLNRYAARVMRFWRCELGLGPMGVGEFKAWDSLVLDVAKFINTSHILDKFEGFELRMSDLVEWSSLKQCGGLSNMAATSIKPESGVRRVVDMSRVFIEWSHLAINIKIEENEDPQYTKDDDDFETPANKKKNVVKGLKKKDGGEKKKFVCDEKMKEAGKRKALNRVKAAKKARLEGGADKETELAMALSLSEVEARRAEEVRREREEVEARREQEEVEARRVQEVRREQEELEARRAEVEARKAQEVRRKQQELKARRAEVEARKAEDVRSKQVEVEARRAEVEARRAEKLRREQMEDEAWRAEEVRRELVEEEARVAEVGARREEEVRMELEGVEAEKSKVEQLREGPQEHSAQHNSTERSHR